LFIGTLRKYLDNDKINALAKKYAFVPPPSDFENVSRVSAIISLPISTIPLSKRPFPIERGRKTGAIQTGFDKNAFLKALLSKDPRIKETIPSAPKRIRQSRPARRPLFL
jgi:hypothetical protein